MFGAKPPLIANAVLFQVGWLVCILGGNAWALCYCLVVLVLHHYFCLRHWREWQFIALFACVGSALDSILFATGIFKGEHNFAPLWLVCLWLLFATTFNHSLRWFSLHPRWSAAFAAIFAPASYWAGVHLNDEVSMTKASLPLLAGLWAVLYPAGHWLSSRLLARAAQPLTVFLLFCLPLCAQAEEARSVMSGESVEVKVVGIARSLEKSNYLYRESHVYLGPGRWRVDYLTEDNELIARKSLDFSSGAVSPSFEQDNFLHGDFCAAGWPNGRLQLRRGRIKGDGSRFDIAKQNFSLIPSLSSKPDDSLASASSDPQTIKQSSEAVVVDAGFDNLVREHWEALVAGRAFEYRFALAPRLATYAMKLAKVDCGKLEGAADEILPEGVACFGASPRNFFLRWLAADIFLVYDSATRRLLRYQGPTNIANAEGDFPLVDIVYHYRSNQP